MYDHKKKELYCSFFFYNYSIYAETDKNFRQNIYLIVPRRKLNEGILCKCTEKEYKNFMS